MLRVSALCLAVVIFAGSVRDGAAQAVVQPAPAAKSPPAGTSEETMDLLDLVRVLRHKEPHTLGPASWEPLKPMIASAPVVGYKPSSGGLVGLAGNVALFHGDPGNTRISSAVASLTYSSKKQVSALARFSIFARGDRRRLDGDNRLQWTSEDTYGLGTETTPADRTNARFDFFRFYDTEYFRVHHDLFVGVGLHYSRHSNVAAGEGASEGWDTSPYVRYSRQNGFALDGQTSGGLSANLLVDTRDSAINAQRGWLVSATYRPFIRGFMGGDSTWHEAKFDIRTYLKMSDDGRHRVALWLLGDVIVSGVAPFFDLPATGLDTYGRSARGYSEGRFRGERLLYGEIEYRVSLMRNGLLGLVVFANTTTLSNLQAREHLTDSFLGAGGIGLRMLINKRSRTNLCIDVGVGQKGSHGLYLAIQEAF
ncbi:MAG TPA: BamA/TamA family outer membrane protein [Vicinamibacterales bacterium]|jgi:hypothetical protein